MENEGFPAERITVIPNGVDTSAFFPVEDWERREIRRKLDLKNDWFVIVVVARLDPIKDHKTALRAFEHVFSHCSQARLLLVGDGPLREELVQYTASRRLTGVVMFCGEQKNVLPYYQCADCFLLTSVSEGAPISVLEAMATGLPVVATHCGDLPSIVEHGATGYLAPVGDDALLAHYLLEIASNRESARRMGMAGRLVCESKYSWASTVSRYAQLYKTTLREASNGREYEHLSLFR
jgi:glycosyltransferase involved in cell wall biosynthesis